MCRSLGVTIFLIFAVFHVHGSVQTQMEDDGLQQEQEIDLETQVRELQRNVSDLWAYIYNVKLAFAHHLTHLKQHQEALESTVHNALHHNEHSGHGDSHSHGSDDDHHHHGDDQTHGDHTHADEHGEDHGHHSHSGEQHSHGDDHHSHSSEQHGHGNEHHSHSDEQHSHSSSSHSHSHTDDHTSSGHDGHHSSHEESDHHHDHDHKDHKNESGEQQTQVVEPLIKPVQSQQTTESHHHHHHHHSTSSSSGGDPLQLFPDHHHSHGHRSSRNRNVILPRFSEYGSYDIASCDVKPNSALPEEQQQDVKGQIYFWQRKTGGPLNIYVSLSGFDVGGHSGHHEGQQTMQHDNDTPVQEVGHRHGFHIHESSDLSNGCQSTGPHFNPKQSNHGAPDALVRHIGDLGNIECDERGVTNIVFSDDIASLSGQYSILERSLAIHANKDDYGLTPNNPESLKTGNAGRRLACCVIEKIDRLPLRTYKAIKSAMKSQSR